MPNWAEGTLKLRGKTENIVSALKEMLLENQGTTLEEEYDGTLLTFKTENDYFYINGTRRAFISGKDIEIWLDEDFVIIELENFKQAWAASAGDYTEISSKFDVDIKIFTFEMGMEFTQEIEISKGEIIKNIVNENFTNYSWDVPFSRLGG
ncbi:hypothetical protein ACIY19_09235 [Streptococcus sp. ST14]|uniref:hypothetical protein n=1 Tax=Streptococcus sp. ST14 TaxID=3378284 RepID=UPI0038D41F91